MNTQVAEVTSSAQALSQMAQLLQTLTAQFKLDEHTVPAPIKTEAQATVSAYHQPVPVAN
jgi:hypothetical protein